MVDGLGPEPEELFDGIPYPDLPIDAIDWQHRADHIRKRSIRKGPHEFNLEPEWATQAALDSRRLVSPGSSETSVEIIGFSADAPSRGAQDASGRVLKVWVVPKEIPPVGDWWGASACDANEQDRRDYWREER